MRAKTIVKRLALLILLGLLFGSAWYFNRPQPPDIRTALFGGVEYSRISVRKPRPVVLHFIEIDLKKAKPSFCVTAAQMSGDLPYKATLVSKFLEESKAQLAINGSFFTPWWSNGILDYYPHVGDPLKTKGISASKSVVYCPPDPNYPALYLSAKGEPSFEKPAEVYDALAAKVRFMSNGKFLLSKSKDRFSTGPEPRTAIGLNADKSRMIIMVVDGRQPRYSEGVTLEELSKFAKERGVTDALAFDGGGSTALVAQAEDGSPKQLNCPIDKRIPGRERPVANHLGIYLER